MPVSLYTVTVPPFIHGLRTLSLLLKQGQEHAASGAITEDGLLKSQLIADMKPLTYQIQRVSDTAKGLAVRAGGHPAVPMADDETTFADLHERIEKTIKVLEGVAPDSMDGKEENEVTMGEQKLTVTKYVTGFAVPNFYFHLVTAYALLRKEGVQVGKRDFLGTKLAK